jgi:lysozyme
VRRSVSIAVLVGCGSHTPVPSPPPPRPPAPTCVGSGATLSGIDVSTYQGDIDWPAVKAAGVEFAIIRVSHGTDEDTHFATNWSAAHDAGVVRGAYQYFRPSQDPIAQADLALATMGALAPGDLPLVIDVEAHDDLPPADVAAAVRAWIGRVVSATKRQPIVYTGLYFWRDHVGVDITSSPLWHAQYTDEPCPRIAPPWTDWTVWQYTNKGHVDGIVGPVDLDRWRGDRASLDAFVAASP